MAVTPSTFLSSHLEHLNLKKNDVFYVVPRIPEQWPCQSDLCPSPGLCFGNPRTRDKVVLHGNIFDIDISMKAVCIQPPG